MKDVEAVKAGDDAGQGFGYGWLDRVGEVGFACEDVAVDGGTESSFYLGGSTAEDDGSAACGVT